MITLKTTFSERKHLPHACGLFFWSVQEVKALRQIAFLCVCVYAHIHANVCI